MCDLKGVFLLLSCWELSDCCRVRFAVDMAPKKVKQLTEALRAQKAAAPPEEEMPPPPPPPKRLRRSKDVGDEVDKKEEENPKEKKTRSKANKPEDDVEVKPKSRSKPKKAAEVEAQESEPKKRRTDPDATPKPKAKSNAKGAKEPKEIAMPDFELSWANHSKLMDFYGISEADATACLLELVGEDESGRAFWEKFKTNTEPATNPRRAMTRKEREAIQESQLSPSPDTELDGQSISDSSLSGSNLDNMDTQPPEEVPPKETGLSEKELKKIVEDQATPAKKVEVEVGCYETSVRVHVFSQIRYTHLYIYIYICVCAFNTAFLLYVFCYVALMFLVVLIRGMNIVAMPLSPSHPTGASRATHAISFARHVVPQFASACISSLSNGLVGGNLGVIFKLWPSLKFTNPI